MTDALEFGCSVCGSTVDDRNRCPVCDAAVAPASMSIEDAPTLGVKPLDRASISLEDAPTLGVPPVARGTVAIEDAPTIGRVPVPVVPPVRRAGPRRGPPRAPAKRPRPFGPLIELGIVLAIAALALGATLYAIG